ncbi:DoxX family protein [Halorubellus sp. JP-L1]|uniref:DoxX family protein n=1 Tax=Halorubellus sp. JP-L1 TaxID=2715753 RepID=UPI00140E8BCE|nr:DoxX family protein [Halorubellus sp. JP-L1]NHN40619.1 DoxX family protein [Halorubellus sp. JP-L1]
MASVQRRLSALLFGVALAGTTLAGTASAHVRYVVDDPADVGSIVSFVASTLAVPAHAAIVGGSALATATGLLAFRRVRPFQRDRDVFADAMADYRDLLPWLLRLAIGIPLVGAGFSGYYFTPLLESDARLLFIGLGFLLLFGLATRLVAAVGLLLYLAGVAVDAVLLLQFEYVGGFLALVLVGSGRPSADDVLERVASDDDSTYARVDPVHALATRFRERVAPAEPYAPVAIRLSLAGAFVYLGLVEKLLNPGYALAVVAKYDLTAIVPVAPELWVVGAALAEIAVGVVLAVGLYTRAAAGLSLVLFTLTLFGLPDDPVLAHLSLFGLASALVITGAGPFSVDELLRTRSASPEDPDA